MTISSLPVRPQADCLFEAQSAGSRVSSPIRSPRGESKEFLYIHQLEVKFLA